MPSRSDQPPLPGIEPGDLPRLAIVTFECATCGGECEECNGIDLEDERHCPDCVHSCEECGLLTTDENELAAAYTSERPRGNTECLCTSCRFTCADCSNEFADSIDHYTNASDDRICGRCVEDYATCCNCGEVLHNDDIHTFEDSDDYYCQSCYDNERQNREDESPDDEDDGAAIHSHEYKPSPTFYRAATDNAPDWNRVPYLGVELEVDSRRELDRKAAIRQAGLDEAGQWYCKSDGSLSYGFEVVSHPATWEYWKTAELGWMDVVKKHGFRSYDTSSCGMHVHISRAFLTKLDEYKLLAFCKNNVELMTRLSRRRGGQERNLESYARIDTSSTRTLALKVKEGPDTRYEAINLENSRTVEFRLFRGTLDAKSYRRNISLVVALCHFVKWASFRQLTDVQFRVWLKVCGKAVLGKAESKTLLSWINESITGNPAADVAA